ncbi:MFS transporter [Xenophilus arseniciresistens]|uniref:MFS transporter n=1 Tax=Xenophilus arseniciresistens TaxID=1283306 RepID=A0AAE3NC95_9BURK|nr:MFS transporter [Xenophilus arseniciresistens]MDA7418479.1 MFS transporter [Xenophilus arseniciresistens]
MPINPEESELPPLKPRPPKLAALEPLRMPVFRLLWSTWLMANVCMWMSDVASAWMMTTLTTSPIWVALVQTASTLPVFLLGIPSGALADILDRRRWLVATQFWLAGTAVVLCSAIAMDMINAPLLLALTFANGIGLALRWPVFSAIVPELVTRPLLPAAMGLNGIAMNASRIIGPLLAGALIASAGTVWVFALNAVLSIASGFVILRWRREQRPQPLGRERLISAMRVGVQFVRQSPRMRAVLVRVAVSFLHSSAVMALLPLIARGLDGGDAGTFTLLLAAMGAGAIVAVLCLPRLRERWSRDQLVLRGTLLLSLATAVVALAPHVWLAAPGCFFCGAAWITVANSLSVSAQLSLPDWVRARGMSMYQMGIMGASAAGAALWGQVATLSSLTISLLVAAASGTVVMALVLRYVTDGPGEDDVSPAQAGWSAGPPQAGPGESGQVVVTVEYIIDPARARAFRVVMQQTRRARLSEGAIAWELLHDMSQPERYLEHIVDESWTEHLRRFNRATAADLALRERRLAFHKGEGPPVVTRYVVQR